METWTLTWSTLTPISEEAVRALPDNIPGVYRLSYLREDGKYYVFYVGQARDIKKRLLEHLSPEEQNVSIKNYLAKGSAFRYTQITQEDIRSAIEKQAYRYYQPSCNQVEPAGREDIKGNLT